MNTWGGGLQWGKGKAERGHQMPKFKVHLWGFVWHRGIDGRDAGDMGRLDCVDRFCFLGDVLGDGGGVEEATRARVRCAWGKFMELAPILTARRASLKLKGKMYRSCVQRVLVYASETWA